MNHILDFLRFIGVLRWTEITREDAAKEIMAREVKFEWRPQIVEDVRGSR